MLHAQLAGGLGLSLLVAGCSESATSTSDETPQQVWFEEIRESTGIDFVHSLGSKQRFWIPEVTGSGLALFDADGDDDLDLFLVQGADLIGEGGPTASDELWLNQGDGTFVNVTESAGITESSFGMGCAAGDYDGDGDLDLYVTNMGPNVLLRNRGDGTFENVASAAGVDNKAWGTSAAFLDYDQDGDLDLFVANYLRWNSANEFPCKSKLGSPDYCHPNNFDSPDSDTLYENQGDGTFRDVSSSSGIAEVFGNGLGVAWGDMTGDGRVDIYVANDGMANQLWVNQGAGKFMDQALLKGCALSGEGKAEAGMGVIFEDLNGDLKPDLFVTHLRAETNTFYSSGRRRFSDDTRKTGMAQASTLVTGFGTGAADFDQDGLLDIYVTNGRVGDAMPRFSSERPLAEPDQVFVGSGDGVYEELQPRGGIADDFFSVGRGVALGDIDGDGDVDVVLQDNSASVRILRNVAPKAGGWIMLDVRTGNGTQALGAQAKLTQGDKVQVRQVQSADSYCSSSDPRVHFGLGTASGDLQVEITWLDGTQENFDGLTEGQVHRITRGQGR